MLDVVSLELNVYFEEPFWIGMFYLSIDNKTRVCRIIFKTEPTDSEVYQLILAKYQKLKYSNSYENKIKDKPKNYKRYQRLIKKQCSKLETGTKSMQILKQEYLHNKELKKKEKRITRQKKQEELYRLKKQKRKAKHRGH